MVATQDFQDATKTAEEIIAIRSNKWVCFLDGVQDMNMSKTWSWIDIIYQISSEAFIASMSMEIFV